MSIRTYIANSDNKVSNIGTTYKQSGMKTICMSNNAVVVDLLNQLQGSQIASMYKSVSFGNNVLSISNNCCRGFTNLEYVQFGNKLKHIGDNAFYDDAKAKEASFPASLTCIGNNAFYNCASLASVSFSSTQLSIGSNAFYGSGIQSLSLTATSTGEAAFSQSKSLAEVNFTGQLAAKQFQNCTNLAKVSLANCTSIPANAFSGCTSLTSFTISNPASLERIEDEAFSGCTGLPHFGVNFSNFNIQYIGKSFIYGNTQMKTLTLASTISQLSQLNPQWLGGSSIASVKFNGMDSTYMEAHSAEFTSFGAPNSIVFESSDGTQYKLNENGKGLRKNEFKAYLITVAISNNTPENILYGMFLDNSRFLSMVDSVYSGNRKSIIIGKKQLGDGNNWAAKTANVKPAQNYPLATVASLDEAFDAAYKSGAEFLIFMFSDHGETTNICLYNSTGTGYAKYTYDRLYKNFARFKAVYAFLCCCYPNFASKDFDQYSTTTKALIWCGSEKDRLTEMTYDRGHNFMTRLENKFSSSYTYVQQWNRIKTPKLDGNQPQQYIYNNFDVNQSFLTYKGQ